MSLLQIKASDPGVSTWVSASAGTGKTKILTDRVLRLLLQDVQFSKILCLTFTNVAATEMQERIILQLELWSKYPQPDLVANLKNTIGKEPTYTEITKARMLFDFYLKSQNQIGIYTIHSFCQKILKQFPIEAKISPSFKVIDEFKVIEIVKKIKRKIFYLPEFSHIVRFFAENFHEMTIDEIFNEIISLKTNFQNSVEINSSVEINCEFVAKTLEITEKLSRHHEFFNEIEIPLDLKVKQHLLKQHSLKDEIKTNPTISDLKPLFLTLEGEKKKRLFSKTTKDLDPDLAMKLEETQEKIYQLDQDAKTQYMNLYSSLFKLIGKRIVSEYDLYKKQNALLDYDDLIIYTKNLLTNSQNKEWVLYKLDGGIEHLLVDEAQDTSKNQWSIIEALIAEFYSGESASKDNRTIFIVGDEKQSIFSFQGADIAFFSHMNKTLSKKLSDGQKPFEIVDLDISYRSTKEILTIVEDVFSKIANNGFKQFTSNLLQMNPYRSDSFGLVELWPLVKDEETNDFKDAFWPVNQPKKANNSKVILAEKIAKYVKNKISSGATLPSTKAPINASDFLILFRTRDDFTDEVIKALKREEIDITGLDKILLAENLGVSDLMSIAKFVLNPENDLNLSALLKSPIFKLTEEDLQNFVTSSKNQQLSIWQYLNLTLNHQICITIADDLRRFINLYKNFPVTDFFLYISEVLNYRINLIEYNEDIDEFLKISKNYLLETESSLQGFVYWFEENQIFAKRDTNAKNKLRIMTTHGSKGLQAPIVILCDTTKIPTSRDRFIWDENGDLLTVKSASYAPEFYKNLQNKQQQKAYQEYLRLLYVGMTRAEDQLLVCGYQSNNTIPENCWYELIRSSMKELGKVGDDQILYTSDSAIDTMNSQANLTSINFIDIVNKINTISSIKNIDFDNFVNKNKQENLPKPNLKNYAKDSLEYGLIFHKILEDSISSRNLSKAYNHPLISGLSKKNQQKLKTSLDKIINNIEFTSLLEYEFKTELSFGYKDLFGTKIGRIDLLIIKDDEIIIIDYKSDNIDSPSHKNLADNKYIQQLSFYKKAFTEIYKDKNILCKILWLENGLLQNLGLPHQSFDS